MTAAVARGSWIAATSTFCNGGMSGTALRPYRDHSQAAMLAIVVSVAVPDGCALHGAACIGP
jgi:hypothetical protein